MGLSIDGDVHERIWVRRAKQGAGHSSSVAILPGMSGLEHYPRELVDVDHEIHHYAAVCGIDLTDRGALLACLAEHHDKWADDRSRETLRGLLLLRIRIETEMLEQGVHAPEIASQVQADRSTE